MKIDISAIDMTQFMCHPHQIGGELCYLVQPQHVGAKWARDNLFLRSSVWAIDGNLVSASFPKFFNLGEKSDLYPDPVKYKDWSFMEKRDGSTLCFSLWKNNLIIRTRGTVDARKIDNGYEIDYLLEKYPLIEKKMRSYGETAPITIITEWETPTNVIVLKHKEPQLVLINVIDHNDYSMWLQKDIDTLSVELNLPRPERFLFDSVDDMIKTVTDFQDKEGICLYYAKDQRIVKIKSSRYLMLHKLKSELSNIEKVLDLYLEQNQPSYNDFYQYISDTLDHEIAETVRGDVSNIVDAKKEVDAIINHMVEFVKELSGLSRKDQALKIQSSYGGEKNNRCSFVFSILDGKEFTKEMYKKLYFQILKNI